MSEDFRGSGWAESQNFEIGTIRHLELRQLDFVSAVGKCNESRDPLPLVPFIRVTEASCRHDLGLAQVLEHNLVEQERRIGVPEKRSDRRSHDKTEYERKEPAHGRVSFPAQNVARFSRCGKHSKSRPSDGRLPRGNVLADFPPCPGLNSRQAPYSAIPGVSGVAFGGHPVG